MHKYNDLMSDSESLPHIRTTPTYTAGVSRRAGEGERDGSPRGPRLALARLGTQYDSPTPKGLAHPLMAGRSSGPVFRVTRRPTAPRMRWLRLDYPIQQVHIRLRPAAGGAPAFASGAGTADAKHAAMATRSSAFYSGNA